jgi:VWFA-related protein
MRVQRTILAVGFVVAGLAGFAGMRTSAAPPKNAGDAGTIQVFSRESVVDVTATDAAGLPIRGLTQQDFTILEDGQPQPIRHFEEVDAQWSSPARNLSENTYSSQQPPAPSPAVNLLLLDLENEAPVDSTDAKQMSQSIAMQSRVKKAAMQAMLNMPEGTRIAVLAMTTNLRIVQSVTSDRTLLAAAINAVPYDINGNNDGGKTSSTSSGWEGDKLYKMPGENAGKQAGNSSGNSDENNTCIQSDVRNRSVLESLARIATDSEAIHGRKNLIWFTVGIPAITDPTQRAKCLPDYSLGLSHAYDLLTAAQVSIYPINAGGLVVGNTSEGLSPDFGAAQLSEEMVAEATGGVAYSNTNDIATAVSKALENGANYYSIAYTPPSVKYDGTYHKIEVKVDQPNVHLVFRKGYYADDIAKLKMPPGLSLSTTPPIAEKGDMKAPMSRGLATSSDLIFDVHVEPNTVDPKPDDPPIMGTLDPKLHNRHLTRYAFEYSVPIDQIAYKNGKKGAHDAELSFNIAVYDSNDKLMTGLSQEVKSTLTDASYQQRTSQSEPIKLVQQIDLPPGQMFIRVGVLDHVSNKNGTLELPLKIAKPKAPALPQTQKQP